MHVHGIFRWMKKRRKTVMVMLCILVVAALCFELVLSLKALPKACLAHEKTVRAEISQRVYNCVELICKNISAELSTQTFYDENGYISHIDLDFVQINEICQSVVSTLSNNFAKRPTVDISVPFGSIVGIGAFTGKGPRIKVRAYMYPAFSAKVESSFSDAGINQTLHKITLTVCCDTVSVCADETVEISQSFDFNIIQSIIVGTVPFS